MKLLNHHQIPYGKVVGVGLSIPGIVDKTKGVIHISDQLKWEKVHIVSVFKEVFQKEITVENDMKAKILSLKNSNAFISKSNMVSLILGVRVSAVAISNGKLVRGVYNSAGEIGHICYEKEGEPCACGEKGCLQTKLSSKYILKKAQSYVPTITNMEDIYEAYTDKQVWALDLMDEFEKALFFALNILEFCYNPEELMITGKTVGFFPPHLIEKIIQQPQKNWAPNAKLKIEVMSNKIEGSAVGSALIALNYFLYTYIERKLEKNTTDESTKSK